MTAFDETVRELCTLHGRYGYRLAPALVRGSPGTQVKVVFDHSVFDTAIVALPGILLGDGGPGDRFLSGGADKPKRLSATLAAIDELCGRLPMDYRVIQLGDWFDLEQAGDGNPHFADPGRVESVPAYADIIRLDAKLRLLHVIGNHDATFLAQVPPRRALEPERFRHGFWLGNTVYALHGHEGSLVFGSGPSADHEQRLAALSQTLAELVPGQSPLCAHIERMRVSAAVKRWLFEALGSLQPDPPWRAREPDLRPLPAGIAAAAFVQRDGAEQLLRVVRELERNAALRQRRVEVVLATHGAEAAVSWETSAGRPVVIIDAGTWLGDHANVFVAAGNTAAVFEVRAAS
jgi:hypothetical protein